MKWKIITCIMLIRRNIEKRISNIEVYDPYGPTYTWQDPKYSVEENETQFDNMKKALIEKLQSTGQELVVEFPVLMEPESNHHGRKTCVFSGQYSCL